MKRAVPEMPELLALKLKLSIDTRFDANDFKDWVHANCVWLDADWFEEHGSSNAKHPDHVHEIYASARMEYKRRQSIAQCIPPAPEASRPTTSPSATQPESAGSLGSKFFRRRAP